MQEPSRTGAQLNKKIASRQKKNDETPKWGSGEDPDAPRLLNDPNQFKSILEAMTSDLTIRDREYRLTYQSPATLKVFGSRLGDRCYEVFQQRDRICDNCPVELAFQDGKHHMAVREVKLPDGRIAYFENIANPIRDSKGAIVSCLEITNDITHRKQTEKTLLESERRHRRLFESMNQGVVYQGPDGKITSANPAAEEILGLSYDQLSGKTSYDPGWRAIREDGSDLPGGEHPSMKALHTGKVIERFIMGVHHPQKNRHRWISVTAIPLFYEHSRKPSEVYTLFEDITAYKQLNDELSLKAKHIEEANAALRAIIKQLEEGEAELEGRILSNVRQFVLPCLEKLKDTPLSDRQGHLVKTLESNLKDITSAFLSNLRLKFHHLTPREIEVANFITDGKNVKEIAKVLCLSKKTIELHRGNLRKKLGLRNQKINLRSYLMAIR